jgi:hypothetical protein
MANRLLSYQKRGHLNKSRNGKLYSYYIIYTLLSCLVDLTFWIVFEKVYAWLILQFLIVKIKFSDIYIYIVTDFV